jgi:23S rRNA (guanosine2251-2'-O)-methyltransferase
MAAELVYGVHAVLSVLQRSPAAVVSLMLAAARGDKRLQVIEQTAAQHGISIERVERATLDRLCNGGRHQGVAARLAARAATARADFGDWSKPRAAVQGRTGSGFEDFVAALPANVLVLVLDGVQDPHNLGACLRSADAAGAHAVIVPRDHSAPLTPAARKVASGAAETVPLYRVANLARALDALKAQGVWLVGATHDAEEALFAADLTGPTALVLGAEGSGLRRLTREACDRLAHIPMAGTVGSLNVSVAAGICLFEAVRQRRPR